MTSIIFLILQVVILMITPTIKADVVIIPSPEQSFESYKETCIKENYKCTFDLIKERTSMLATPKYDQLILDLDLQSPSFMAALGERIKLIIENEMISMEQLSSLIDILQRAEDLGSNKSTKLLKSELTRLHEMIDRSAAVENFNYFIFKKPVATLSTVRLKTLSIRPMIKEIDFKKEVVDQQKFFFKENQCSQSRLSAVGANYFGDGSHIFADDKNCSWMDSVSEAFKSEPSGQSKFQLSSKQKNIMLWSAVAVGVGLFLSQYEISVEY